MTDTARKKNWVGHYQTKDFGRLNRQTMSDKKLTRIKVIKGQTRLSNGFSRYQPSVE